MLLMWTLRSSLHQFSSLQWLHHEAWLHQLPEHQNGAFPTFFLQLHEQQQMPLLEYGIWTLLLSTVCETPVFLHSTVHQKVSEIGVQEH
nr:hypothetical protein Iba_scaffold2300CG0610 [Ipomoea batatas]